MLSVKEVRSLGSSLSTKEFQKQLGPFVLIQRPPGEEQQDSGTTRVAKAEDITRGMLSLIFEFEELGVATLPPLNDADELSVGRQPDCDLVIEDGSVSKRHAVLQWDVQKRTCSVKDLGSTNGTFLNGSFIGQRQIPLRDGDIVSFGSAQFWFQLTETLHSKLGGVSGARRLGSRSG